MSQRKSNIRELLRFVFLIAAAAVFFVGPRLMENDTAEDISDTIEFVKKSHMPAKWAAPILRQLERDKKFAQENGNQISIFGVKTSSVNWFAFLIIFVGYLIPLVMKYFGKGDKQAGNGT